MKWTKKNFFDKKKFFAQKNSKPLWGVGDPLVHYRVKFYAHTFTGLATGASLELPKSLLLVLYAINDFLCKNFTPEHTDNKRRLVFTRILLSWTLNLTLSISSGDFVVFGAVRTFGASSFHPSSGRLLGRDQSSGVFRLSQGGCCFFPFFVAKHGNVLTSSSHLVT